MKDKLKQFFSNNNKDVFVLTNMPEVLKGALFSRYSRSPLPLRELFIKEYLENDEINEGKSSTKELLPNVNTKRAKEFYKKWLAMYGDDSIAELASIHLGIENLSVLSAKFIEDRRIGISPLEKSTRYVRFDDKENGEYKYYKDPKILKSEFGKEYVGVMNSLFDTYSKLIPEMREYFKKKFPRPEDVSDTAYNNSISAKALDTVRGLLPLATKTNIGVLANGRSVEYLLTRMYAQPLKELHIFAKDIHTESKKFIDNFVERVESDKGKEYIAYLKDTERDIEKVTDRYNIQSKKGERYVRMVEYNPQGDKEAAANIVYAHTNTPYEEILKNMKDKDIKKIIETYVKHRQGRWHKVGKSLETIYYTFEIMADFGAYKDLQRHRMLTLDRQLFTTEYGYEIPEDIKGAGKEKEYSETLDNAHKLYEKVKVKYPIEAQYIVGHGNLIRWKMKMNLREAFHLCELRSSPQGHPSYRQIAQEIYKLLNEVNPVVGQNMKFVNMQNPGLERLSAEVRKEEKLNAVR